MLRSLYIRRSSIQNKFLIMILFLVIIPLGVFGIISLQISKNSIQSQVSQSNLKTLGQIAEKADMLLDEIITLSNTFYLNEEVNHGFTTLFTPDSYEEAMLHSSFERLLANSIYSFGQLKYDVTLIGSNGLQLSSHSHNQNIEVSDIFTEQWYWDAAGANGRILWITEAIPGIIPIQNGISPFYAVRVSNRFENGAPTGIVIISVNEATMKNLYAGAMDDNQKIVIMNDAGSIVSSMDDAMTDVSLVQRSYYSKVSNYESGYFIDRESGEEQLISFQTIEKTGWKLVSYTPTRTVLRSINHVQTMNSIVFILVVLFSILTSYAIARRMAIPIKRLYNSFGRVEMGDLTVRASFRSDDEVGMLARKFNHMVERLQTLMVDITMEQQQKRHAELQALQSQINPHFLYNTLASIRFMLYKHDKETVDSVIVALVRLLKQSISKQDELIPIEEEIDILRNYLYIQQIRQGDKLEVFYDVHEDIHPFKTIKLILQPLVENAIFYGIEPKQGKGTIWIKGKLEDGDIVFEVTDNGIGMKAEVEEWIKSGSNKEGGFSHGGGYRNVHERIQLHYGLKYGLTIHSQSGAGTRIQIRIPAIYK
jgi:two-component system sensor histidine kinase YesM